MGVKSRKVLDPDMVAPDKCSVQVSEARRDEKNMLS